MKKVLLLHGPNLNLLGSREPEKYGKTTSEEIVRDLKSQYPDISIDYLQSNQEGELTDIIQKSAANYSGLLINAGGLSHTSIAMADAIRSIAIPVIAVHISNIYNREGYRHTDIVGEACKGSITGLGTAGYALALECLLDEI
ncbi:MAG: type II 3-dehydroquinate dehydratase [Bacteroidota bacterium]